MWWKLRTGDLVLFSSKNTGSNITKFFTRSKWDHVAVVVRPREANGKVYCVEWCGGLIASELVERLTDYAEFDAREIAVRQLQMPEAFGKSAKERLHDRLLLEANLESFVAALFEQQMGSNRLVPFDQVLRAARKSLLFGSSVSKSKQIYTDDLRSLFCSKTVAVVYKAVGVLAPNRKAADFLPKHYSSGYDWWLRLQHGFSLGPEVPLLFGGQIDVLDSLNNLLNGNSLKAALNAIAALQPEDPSVRAARTIQAAARGMIARRRLRDLRARGKPPASAAAASLAERLRMSTAQYMGHKSVSLAALLKTAPPPPSSRAAAGTEGHARAPLADGIEEQLLAVGLDHDTIVLEETSGGVPKPFRGGGHGARVGLSTSAEAPSSPPALGGQSSEDLDFVYEEEERPLLFHDGPAPAAAAADGKPPLPGLLTR